MTMTKALVMAAGIGAMWFALSADYLPLFWLGFGAFVTACLFAAGKETSR